MPEKPAKPACTLELINPDDILVIGVNNKWFRTFTTSSDRYPIRLEIPSGFINDGWNLITGDYSNVPLVGKNDSNVEYKLLIEGKEVVHVTYCSEVQPIAFSLTFKDTFSLKARSIDRGSGGARRRSSRFDDLMAFHKEAPTVDEDIPVLPTEDEEEGPPGGRIIGRRPRPEA